MKTAVLLLSWLLLILLLKPYQYCLATEGSLGEELHVQVEDYQGPHMRNGQGRRGGGGGEELDASKRLTMASSIGGGRSTGGGGTQITHQSPSSHHRSAAATPMAQSQHASLTMACSALLCLITVSILFNKA